MSISVKKVSLTTAQVKLLTTTPQKLLDAPASGYTNCILGITEFLDYNSVPYATATVLNVYPKSASGTNLGVVFQDTDAFFTSSAKIEKPLYKAINVMQSVFCTENALYLSADADPTAGNSAMTFKIVYEVRKLV